MWQHNRTTPSEWATDDSGNLTGLRAYRAHMQTDNFAFGIHALTRVFVSKNTEILLQLIPISQGLREIGSRSEAIPRNFLIVDFTKF